MRRLVAFAAALVLLAGCGGGNDQAPPDVGWPGWGNGDDKHQHCGPPGQANDKPTG